MKNPFEAATRVAISEILSQNAQETKFGMLITDQAQSDIIEDIYQLLVTSRTLKAAGDRLLGENGASIQSNPTNRPLRNR